MISRTNFRLAGLLLLAASVCAAQVSVPDTPAGHTLQAWLDAFNSGDRARIETYVKTIDQQQSVDGMIGFRNQTGGFELLSIESSEPLHIRFRVKEKGERHHRAGQSPGEGRAAADGGHLWAACDASRSVLENVTIDAAQRKKVIDGIVSELKEYYVDPALAQTDGRCDARRTEAKGDYDAISDGDALAARLYHGPAGREPRQASARGLQSVQDRRREPGPPTPEDEARFHQQMEHDNCAFEKVEILPNNIGYIKFNGFMDASFCGPTVVAAMGFVAHTDALIFDLRENGGGQPAMVTMIASYLFDQPTHLIDIYNRQEDTTTQNWTLSYLPGPRLTKQPVFVLTSKRTFSGAEEFAFDLKNQKRATIVGETTGGGAHPVAGTRLADYFMVGVPFAKSLDPVTKTNWEGTGVEPDVKVPAADALETAQKLAVEKIQAAKKK